MNAAVAPASLTVRRTIAASAEELFDAWLDPAALSLWMVPAGVRRSSARLEARVGGRYEILMDTDEGSCIPHTGEYRVLNRPRQLAFTWHSPHTGGRDTLVTVDFIATGARTEVVITHEQLPDHERASHDRGWSSALVKLQERYAKPASQGGGTD
jgi:uncharacterized protein YndB with AHSA1/START domain